MEYACETKDINIVKFVAENLNDEWKNNENNI